MKCKSEMREELPCPNTCNPGYECTQTEAINDFLIGEVVEEGVAEDNNQEDDIQEEFTDMVDTGTETATATAQVPDDTIDVIEVVGIPQVETAI